MSTEKVWYYRTPRVTRENVETPQLHHGPRDLPLEVPRPRHEHGHNPTGDDRGRELLSI
jgi:hypothetical protein